MAEKKKPQDRRVSVKGKVFTWTTEDGDTLTLPLRIKMKVLRELYDVALDAHGMYKVVETVAPDQVALVDDMDANDFKAGYAAWQREYSELSDASLGESESSSS